MHGSWTMLWSNRLLNRDHKFSEMCIGADHHPGAPRAQYIGEHPNITDVAAQSFVPMRTRGKKGSRGAFDEETGAFVHDRLRILFVTDIYTPVHLDPRVLKLAMKLRIPEPLRVAVTSLIQRKKG